jgi:hypothetical protein
MREAAGILGASIGTKDIPGKPGAVELSYMKEQFDPLRAAITAGTGLAAATTLDVLGEPMEAKLQSMAFPHFQTQSLKNRMFENLASESGKVTARGAGDFLGGLFGQGVGAVQNIPMSREQRRIFGHAVKTDPLLNAATANEKRTLERAFNSMTRFAPELATDEFAVKNFLRESLMSSAGGPDYSTLSNLARASQTLQGDQR